MNDLCRLGEYGVLLIKNGRRLAFAGARPSVITYGRKLDDVSKAKVSFVTAGDDCCGQLGGADHWNTDLVIFAEDPSDGLDKVVWRGPVEDVEHGNGVVDVIANDVLAWMQVRMLLDNMNFDNMDVIDIFEALYSYVNACDPANPITYALHKTSSGVRESRKIDAAAARFAWSVVQEMLPAGLDISTYGGTILAGIPGFGSIKLSDRDVLGDVRVIKDGKQFANRAIANASKDIVGVWPPGPRGGANGYPLVEASVVDSQLTDSASAVTAAKARHDYSSKGVRRVIASGGLELKPATLERINLRTLLAGQMFDFTAYETCYSATETLRLGSLDVTVTKGGEKGVISLQPVGELAGDTV